MNRIDIVPAKKSFNGTKLVQLHHYEVPVLRTNCVYENVSPRHEARRVLSNTEVAIFSRWSDKDNDWIIWKVKG